MEIVHVICPYCKEGLDVEQHENYSPVFHTCLKCNKRFIVERSLKGFDVFTEQDAPCCSNPECREIEMGAGDD